MCITKLEINQNIVVQVTDGHFQGKYLSKISDINEESIRIMAIYDQQYIPLRVNQQLKIFFEGDHAFYSFKSRLKKRLKKPIPMLVISIPNEIKRIQRRNFFRLEIREDVYYRLLKETEEEFKRTVILDISGSGIRILLNENLKIGDILELKLNIANLENEIIQAEIVRFGNTKNNEEEFAGLKFLNIERKIQEQIVSWMFAYQRKLRERGMH